MFLIPWWWPYLIPNQIILFPFWQIQDSSNRNSLEQNLGWKYSAWLLSKIPNSCRTERCHTKKWWRIYQKNNTLSLPWKHATKMLIHTYWKAIFLFHKRISYIGQVSTLSDLPPHSLNPIFLKISPY